MSSVLNQICFDKSEVSLYLFLLIIILIYLTYIIYQIKYNSQKEITNLQKKVLKAQSNVSSVSNINNSNVSNKKSVVNENVELQRKFLDKLYNPLSGTSPMNPQGSFANPRGFDGYRNFQQLGYITGPNGIYPVMGRYKFSNSTDKYDLYTIDNERGRIKIPFKTKNDYLYDGDTINIPELGGEFIFKKYEDIDSNRYDPNIIY
jgi:hypothetical protein